MALPSRDGCRPARQLPRLRFTAQHIDAISSAHNWADRFDPSSRDARDARLCAQLTICSPNWRVARWRADAVAQAPNINTLFRQAFEKVFAERALG
jgi:hypothetical protein